MWFDNINKYKLYIYIFMFEEDCYYTDSHALCRVCDFYSMDNSSTINEYDFSLLKENDILYIKTDKIPEFYKNFHLINTNIVLVTGRSDYTVPDHVLSKDEFYNLVNSEKILHWFCENCIINHEKITNIPIGVDYHTLRYNLNSSWGPAMSPVEQEKQLFSIINSSKPFWERINLGYSNFHFSINGVYGYDRKDAIEKIPKDCIYYEEKSMNRYDTWKKMTEFKFIVSPHSNGLDCVRTWESLMLGCIVIVKTSPLDKMYENLPVIIVDNWEDINKEFLENKCNEFKDLHLNNCFKYEKLTLSYWVNLFNSFKQK